MQIFVFVVKHRTQLVGVVFNVLSLIKNKVLQKIVKLNTIG
jgi:hypothetical protein